MLHEGLVAEVLHPFLQPDWISLAAFQVHLAREQLREEPVGVVVQPLAYAYTGL